MKVWVFLAIILIILRGLCFGATSCRFGTGQASVNFSILDPASSSDSEVSVLMTLRCTGPPKIDPVPFLITDDDGLYETGPDQNRLRNTIVSSEYIPYSFSVLPSSGLAPRNTSVDITIKAGIKASDIQNAYIGSYSDTITLTLSP